MSTLNKKFMTNNNNCRDLSGTADLILYAPFDRERYIVNDRVVIELTEDEFFGKCYVDFDPKKEMEKIQNMPLEEFKDIETDVSVEVIKRSQIDELDVMTTEINNFYRWLDNNGGSIFCIKGDAGVGKTTFLHYLKYMYGKKDRAWEILDIQKARSRVSILKGYEAINIGADEFRNLHIKVASMFMDGITDCIFMTNRGEEEDEYKLQEAFRTFVTEYRNYKKTNIFLSAEAKAFFDNEDIMTAESIPEIHCYASHIKERLMDVYSKNIEDSTGLIYKLWNLYETALRVRYSDKKCIICLDNFERFIGKEEIWNRQLCLFIDSINELSRSRAKEDASFHKQFQFLMLMRNTTSRMANEPLHSLDFDNYELDISGLFPLEEMVKNKLQWYENKGIDVPGKELMHMVLGIESFDGSGDRSLRVKLGRLFNSNKRALVQFVTRRMSSSNNNYFRSFVPFASKELPIPPSLNRHAGRSIIMRMILDGLMVDHFFEHILVAQKDDKQKRLGMARKMLLILRAYAFDHGKNKYMPFDEFIYKYIGEYDSIGVFLEDSWGKKRSRMAKILFFMNYYNQERSDWTHFVDIQYNARSLNTELITQTEDLQKLIEEHHSDVGLRIMEGGNAYLEYIVPSFEYFACRAQVGGNEEYFPSLFELAPTKEEMLNEDISEFRFMKLVARVFEDAKECIGTLQKDPDTERILFYSSADAKIGLTQSQRIVNLHTGYIGNFITFIDHLYGHDRDGIVVDRVCNIREELDKYIYSYKGLLRKMN